MGTTKKTDIKSLILEFVRVHDEHTKKVIELREAQVKAEQAERERYHTETELKERIVATLKKSHGLVWQYFKLPDGRVCEVQEHAISVTKLIDLT